MNQDASFTRSGLESDSSVDGWPERITLRIALAFSVCSQWRSTRAGTVWINNN
jgi:hypothetical protein